jgi:hypothetical protein
MFWLMSANHTVTDVVEEVLCEMQAPPNRRRTETGTKRCQPHKPATPQREVAGNQAKQFKVHQQDEGD